MTKKWPFLVFPVVKAEPCNHSTLEIIFGSSNMVLWLCKMSYLLHEFLLKTGMTYPIWPPILCGTILQEL